MYRLQERLRAEEPLVDQQPDDVLQELPGDVRVVLRDAAEVPERDLEALSGVSAVTVAVRTPSLISASSPKCSPGPSLATSRPSTITEASPSVMMKKPTPLISFCRTIDAPALNRLSRKSRPMRFSCRWFSSLKSGMPCNWSDRSATR